MNSIIFSSKPLSFSSNNIFFSSEMSKFEIIGGTDVLLLLTEFDFKGGTKFLRLLLL